MGGSQWRAGDDENYGVATVFIVDLFRWWQRQQSGTNMDALTEWWVKNRHLRTDQEFLQFLQQYCELKGAWPSADKMALSPIELQKIERMMFRQVNQY